MKRTIKILCVLIAMSLCIFATTFCGCSKSAEYVEGSFRITSVDNSIGTNKKRVHYEYKISAKKAGLYNVEFHAKYGNLGKAFGDSITCNKSGVETDEGSVTLECDESLRAGDIKVTVLSVSLETSYSDDTSYFAIGLAFGLFTVGVIATGVTFLVLSKKKKRRKKE